MITTIFLLGLPGSGKSTIARSIASFINIKRWSLSHFNDYTVLRDLLNAEISLLEGTKNQLRQFKASKDRPKENNLGLPQQLSETLNQLELLQCCEEILSQINSVCKLQMEEDPTISIYSEFIDLLQEDVIERHNNQEETDNEYDFINYLNEMIALLGRVLLLLVIFSFSLLEKLIQRFLAISLQILNRVSRSPSPQKKEPPVGGVKVGGKQYDAHGHVAEILYPTKTLKFAAC